MAAANNAAGAIIKVIIEDLRSKLQLLKMEVIIIGWCL
jgi:hypothetical protein